MLRVDAISADEIRRLQSLTTEQKATELIRLIKEDQEREYEAIRLGFPDLIDGVNHRIQEMVLRPRGTSEVRSFAVRWYRICGVKDLDVAKIPKPYDELVAAFQASGLTVSLTFVGRTNSPQDGVNLVLEW